MNFNMKQIFDLEECKGKTIKNIEIEHGYIVKVHFTDETFAEFIAAYNGNDCGVYLKRMVIDFFAS